MKLTRFRVQNYKKINDTGWVDVGQMTAFVGKNEAGKSAVFRGLSKLNPSDGAKYDGLKEFPRRRYANEFKQRNWPVSSAVFELSKDETVGLTKISDTFKRTTSVTVTRYYNNKGSVKYEPSVQRYRLTRSDFKSLLDHWQAKISALESPSPEKEIGNFKDAMLKTIKDARAIIPKDAQIARGHLLSLQIQLRGTIKTPWQKTLATDVTSSVDRLLSRFKVNEDMDKAFQFIWNHLPKFIYFDRYDVLDSAIYIDEFIRKLNDHPNDPKIRITKCLFEHVGLDINEIQQLDPSTTDIKTAESRRMADKRSVLLDAAASEMTEKFAKWWKQRKHKFSYRIDGPHFRVWVSDDLDASEIELDQRSAGMQYFFSFFLVFLTESAGRHANSILLLDDPGLQLHGTAQQQAVEFLRKLSADNQLLYTTHSPFMVDADHLEDVRIVTEAKDDHGATRISNNVWPRDPDALFPLQAGLGYNIAQSLFYSNRQVVVEGITDYMYLKAASSLLARHSLRHLDHRIIISPAGGTRNMMRLASLLLANNVRAATVLDGDKAGLQASKRLKEIAADIVIIDDFTGKEKSEIEDMFDEKFFMSTVEAAYPGIGLDFNDDEKKILSVVRRVSALFERKGKDFNKHTVCTTILGMLNNKNSTFAPADMGLDKFEKLFEKLNDLCSPPPERAYNSPADPQ